MNNTQFARYATNTAFNLTLSRTAIEELLFMQSCRLIAINVENRLDYGVQLNNSLSNYLVRRGFIAPCLEKTCEENWVLTEAGLFVCPLLRAAGFNSFVDSKVLEDVKNKDILQLSGYFCHSKSKSMAEA